jgi:LPXTG-site transpeptidase (sortase) family protein
MPRRTQQPTDPQRARSASHPQRTALGARLRAHAASIIARPRTLLALAGMLAAVVIAATQLVGGAGRFQGSAGAVSISPVSGSARARLSAGGDGAATVEDKTLHSLESLRQRYGDPPQADAGRMRIPAINVDAPIGRRVVAKDGVLLDPIGPSDIAWYDFANLPGFGGIPGSGGNAVFAAHVDRAGHLDYAGVDYSGPGIFFWLDRLNAGDVIEVTMRGKTLRYAVTWAREVPVADHKDWDTLLASNVGADSITLVTCGGTFDRQTQEYESRLVVRATRA